VKKTLMTMSTTIYDNDNSDNDDCDDDGDDDDGTDNKD